MLSGSRFPLKTFDLCCAKAVLTFQRFNFRSQYDTAWLYNLHEIPMCMFKPRVEDVPYRSLIFFYILPLAVINNSFKCKHQVFYLGPLVHSAMDNTEGFTGELLSAVGEFNFVSIGCYVAAGEFYKCACMHMMCMSSFYCPRCSVVEVVCGRCSVAQEPGGGTSDGGAGVQRGHAAHAAPLHRTHSCRFHGSAVLRCWYGNLIFRL